MNQYARQNASYTGFSGLMMLAYGWGMGIHGTSSSAFYNMTVAVVQGVLKFGGIALVAVAVISYMGLGVSLILEAIASGICGAILVMGSLYWMISGQAFGMIDFIFLIFGGLLLKDAVSAWQALRLKPRTAPLPVQPARPEPIHPASVRSSVLPGVGEPAPEEGYLAALAREQEKPPTANYE
jgi:hypothetical protein